MLCYWAGNLLQLIAGPLRRECCACGRLFNWILMERKSLEKSIIACFHRYKTFTDHGVKQDPRKGSVGSLGYYRYNIMYTSFSI